MAKKKDDGYPFETGDWAKWSNEKKLAWLKNFRDKLRQDNGAMAKKFAIGETELAQMDRDVQSLEIAVKIEKAKLN